MNPRDLIDRYYADHEIARRVLLAHSHLVARKAVTVAEHLRRTSAPALDVAFIGEAAWLHDIGIVMTDTPALGCDGTGDYITHGVRGAEILLGEGMPRHALVCERHIGVGLSVEDIRTQQLPLPLRDMRPQTLEEQIVAYADLFFSKSQPGMRTADQVRASLARFDRNKVTVFDDWHNRFEPTAGKTTVS